MMNKTQVMALLKANQNREGMQKWKLRGAERGKLKSYGIGLSVLRKLAKQIGRDHALSLQLWNSDVYDAKAVALMIDEPKERGGTDLGPSPVATMLSSLVACTNRITNKIAERNGIAIDGLAVKVDAKFDRTCLEEDIPVPFPAIDIHIEITTPASWDEIDIIKRELPIHCPVSKVFRQAGTKVVV